MGMRVLAVRYKFVRYPLRQRRQQWAVRVSLRAVVVQVSALLMRVSRFARMDMRVGGRVMAGGAVPRQAPHGPRCVENANGEQALGSQIAAQRFDAV